jgi:probable HAF family extracellular repeat protein
MSHWKWCSVAVCGTIFLLVSGGAGPASAQGYNVTPLLPPSGFFAAQAVGLNDHGQVVGDAEAGSFCCYPVIWNNGVPSALATPLPDQVGIAVGINNAGAIAGFTGSGQPFVSATVWNAGIPTNLGPLSGGGEVTGLNNAGQVVGWDVDNGAVTWKGGVLTQLASPPGARAVEATAINDAGQIVGWSSDFGAFATVWNDGVPTILGSGEALGINNVGQIVGEGDNGPTLWSAGNIIDLGTLDGTSAGYAAAINDAGQIVGLSEPANSIEHATLWDNGTITDLNTVLTASGIGLTLTDALAINDLGQILATSGSGAYLLTPCEPCQIVETLPPPPVPSSVPESSTWAMMLIGFAGLGFAGYRATQKSAAAGLQA